MRLPSRLRRTLNIERLEDRTVPAGITGTLQNGVLTILGTPGDDTIVVRFANKTVSVDGTKIEAEANRIVIDAGAGNDVIRLDSQTFANQDALDYYARALVVCEKLGDAKLATSASLAQRRAFVNFTIGRFSGAIADMDRAGCAISFRAVAKRAWGDLAIARWTAASAAGATLGLAARRLGGGASTTWRISVGPVPAKGARPVNI